jgi:hypothetical protein
VTLELRTTEKNRLIAAYQRGRAEGREQAMRDLVLELQAHNFELLNELKEYEQLVQPKMK